MKRIAALILPLGLAGAAFAQTLPTVEDTDANGVWSLVELQTVWPELTEDGFGAVDTNADGGVDPVELQAALDGGVLKPVEG
jgi:hypothetical protein